MTDEKPTSTHIDKDECIYPAMKPFGEPVSEYDVDEWEEREKVIALLVCSVCGRIGNDVCPTCLSDNWHFNAKVVSR